MARRIRVRAVPRQEPDARLYALALIELARQLQEAEEADSTPREPGDHANDRRRGGTRG